ncbi:hypothetical protein [Pseudopelagicola sp. nBUS_19]|uniref:hypothetical protein n=1 Tax=Pseudopelagicola sp. nBUS_19 TaxID=3395316 RepID=UPI003EBAEFF8
MPCKAKAQRFGDGLFAAFTVLVVERPVVKGMEIISTAEGPRKPSQLADWQVFCKS